MEYLLSLLITAVILCSCGGYTDNAANNDGSLNRDTLNQESPYGTPGSTEDAQPGED